MEFLKDLIKINNEYSIEKISENNNYDDIKLNEIKLNLLKRNNRLFTMNKGIIINNYRINNNNNNYLRLINNNNI